VFGVNQRIIERVGLVIVLDHRLLERLALFAAEPLRHRTRDDISHHGFDRNDIQAFAQHLAIVQAAHKMGSDPGAFQQREEQFRHPVVHHALGFDGPALFGVERGRIVLEVLDHEVRVRSRV